MKTGTLDRVPTDLYGHIRPYRAKTDFMCLYCMGYTSLQMHKEGINCSQSWNLNINIIMEKVQFVCLVAVTLHNMYFQHNKIYSFITKCFLLLSYDLFCTVEKGPAGPIKLLTCSCLYCLKLLYEMCGWRTTGK